MWTRAECSRDRCGNYHEQYTTAAILGLALIASSAQAHDYKINIADKSPAALQAAIADAAQKACREVYADDVLAVYQMADCEGDAINEANAQLNPADKTAATTEKSTLVAER